MRKTPPLIVGLAALLFVSSFASAAQTNMNGPAGSGEFGGFVTVLPNGNFVVVDQRFDKSGPTVVDAGAVYLYSPNGTLISTLTGSAANDKIGDKIFVLSNGNFVVQSIHGLGGTGCMTWVNGATGLTATVSSSNSVVLAASTESNVIALPNGNYLIQSTGEGGGTGAVMFCDGTTGASGTITSATALVGATNLNASSTFAVTVLTNGNYVVSSPTWDDGVTANLGAVTWCSGTTGRVGTVSAANSLIGASQDDYIGAIDQGGGVVPLNNGNYVVYSSLWDNGTTINVGAVTWCDGTAGLVATVNTTNSLYGTTANDAIGTGSDYVTIVPLTYGNYVVVSPDWDNGCTQDVGAVTWCDGSTGRTGAVSASNSVIGTTADDQVGSGDVLALTNGSFVICSPLWDGSAVDEGAATWCDGNTGFPSGEAGPAAVSETNSLHGGVADDKVGLIVGTVLTNGNYLVCSPYCDNGATVDAGAVTWGNGATGSTGTVSVANSLMGAGIYNGVGAAGAVALLNGNYVVPSSGLSLNGVLGAGAATWGNGSTGTAGVISPSNSLTGLHTGDGVGALIFPLPNGNYVVGSPGWDNGTYTDAGAATWCDGTTGRVAVVSGLNSIVGTGSYEYVGALLTALTNSNYLLPVSDWDNGATANVGAVIMGDGANGTSGPISAANALIGSSAEDKVGNGGIVPLSDGNYVVLSLVWNNGAATIAGAATVCDGATGLVGTVNATNSIVATVSDGGGFLPFGYDAAHAQIVVGLGGQNVVARSGAQSVEFASSLYTFVEGDGTVNLMLKRKGTLPFSVFVTTSATGATATAGADYTAINAPGTQVDFALNQTTAPVSVTILNGNAVNEANETFKVVLSNPTNGVTLGTVSTTTVRIIDGGDATAPSAPVITTPAANASLNLFTGAFATVSGSATDNKGIANVQVQLNGGPFADAILTSNSGVTANYTLNVVPVAGTNTINVRSIDTTGFTSALATRTFKVLRPLFVQTNGQPGTLTAGFAPFSFKEVGKSVTITATAATMPAPGTLFDDWSVTGIANPTTQMGVTASAFQKNTITFIFREDMVLTAEFSANPYTAGIVGTYNGYILPSPTQPDRAPLGMNTGEDGTVPSTATQGSFTATLMSTGAFSGKISLDGMVLNVAGNFDSQGHARFGTARVLTLVVPRTSKPSLFVTLDASLGSPVITGTVAAKDFLQSVTSAVSTIEADRAFYTGLTLANTVPDDYLTVTGSAPSPTGRSDGMFTVLFPSVALGSQPARIQNGGFTTQDYPQGCGVGTIKVSKAGLVTLTGTLADGAAVTASSTLSETLRVSLFAALYTNKGFLSSILQLNSGDSSNDMQPVAGTVVLWSRPFNSASHYYPYGWPEVIMVNMIGAKYVVTAGQSVLKANDGPDGDFLGDPLPAADADGNVVLVFRNAQLTEDLVKTANLSTADVVTKVPDNDATFTMMVNRTTGAITGTFSHTDDTVPAYNAIIFQKGPSAGAKGYFLTKQPIPIDYTGESGAVFISAGL